MIETPHADDSRPGVRPQDAPAPAARAALFALQRHARADRRHAARRRHARHRSAGHRHAHLHLRLHDGQLHARGAHGTASKVIVCDRPNPIGGVEIEGITLEPGYESFVGQFPIPTRHGMTIGELARLFNEHFGIGADLEVDRRWTGWQRAMYWDDTGLAVGDAVAEHSRRSTARSSFPARCTSRAPTPRKDAARRGPFELVGAPWVRRRNVCGRAQCARVCPASISARSCSSRRFKSTRAWRAAAARFTCSIARRSSRCSPASRSSSSCAPPIRQAFAWKPPPYEYEHDKVPDRRHRRVASRSAQAIDAGERAEHIAARWEPSVAAFRDAATAVSCLSLMARPPRLNFERTVIIQAPPERVLAAFFDPHDLAEWWQVVRSVTVPRPLGTYAVEWQSTDVSRRAARPARRRVSRHGDGVPRRRGVLRRRRLLESARGRSDRPDGARSALHAARWLRTRRRSVVRQSAEDDGPRWQRYFEIVARRAGSRRSRI